MNKQVDAIVVGAGIGGSIAGAYLAKAGQKVRLPTEAEWEYVCRAGTTTAFFSGDDSASIDEYAWHSANSGKILRPIGEKKPNPWGLYDINGSMCHYCSDWFSPDAYTNEREIDPQGPAFSPGGGHVLRGAVFNMGGVNWCRSACRLYDTGASGKAPLVDHVVVGVTLAALGTLSALAAWCCGGQGWMAGAYLGGVVCVAVGFILTLLGLITRYLARLPIVAGRK